jgi:hypothetical protein
MINEIVTFYCVTPSEQLPVEQELLSLPEHMSLHPVFSLVRVARSLVLCVVHCGSLFVFFLLIICSLSTFYCLKQDNRIGHKIYNLGCGLRLWPL